MKNARSLTSDARLEEVLEELGEAQWDVVFFKETWRLEAEEDFLLESGHRFFGSGGARRTNSNLGKHGVGILLHQRWSKFVVGVRAVSAQIVYVDLQIGRFVV